MICVGKTEHSELCELHGITWVMFGQESC